MVLIPEKRVTLLNGIHQNSVGVRTEVKRTSIKATVVVINDEKRKAPLVHRKVHSLNTKLHLIQATMLRNMFVRRLHIPIY